MSLQAAIDFWHELLAADPLTTWEQFQSATQTDRLYFGTRPVCSVLRPHFLSPRAYSYLVEASRIVRGALGKAYDYLLTHDALRASLGVSSQEDALLALEPTRGPGDYSGRLDAFYLADAVPAAGQHPTLNFVEYNAESPGGLAFGESLSAIFRGLPLFAAFAQHYQVTSFAPRPRILAELLAGYRAWGGQGKPRIAIVDWRGVRTYREFELCQDYFRSQGYDVGIFDPDELEQAPDGRLTAGDFAIDLVYKRVVTLELLAKYGAEHPLMRAVGQHTVCMVNSFNAVLLFNKGLFALLSDSAFPLDLSPVERLVIRRHLPWTRLLVDGSTEVNGRAVDLLAYAAANRDSLVIKPTNDYGGRGVILGWECDQAAWDAALSAGLQTPAIVQKRVPVPQANFPSIVDGRLDLSPRLVDVDPYVWGCADIAGGGVRLSTSSLLNVSAGDGSAAPLFVIEPVMRGLASTPDPFSSPHNGEEKGGRGRLFT